MSLNHEPPRSTTAPRDDLSRGGSGASTEAAPRRTREDALIHGYRNVASDTEVRPCACGGFVHADPAAPGRGVRAHQFTPRHKGWRAAHGFDEPYPGAVE